MFIAHRTRFTVLALTRDKTMSLAPPPKKKHGPLPNMGACWLGKFFPVSDLNPRLHSLLLLVPVATCVCVCLCVCLWDGDCVHSVDTCGHVRTYSPLAHSAP